jgi:glycosyltransferase involved in cell wall biosynthesis
MTKKRKIAIVNVFFAPNSIGGATRVVEDNVEALRKNHGDEIDVVVFTTHPDHKEDYQLNIYPLNGIRVYSLSTVLIDHLEWASENDRVQKIFEEFLEFEKPDLVHFHCIQRLTASVLRASQLRKVPYIVTVHDAWWISDYQFLVDQQGNVLPEVHEDVLSAHRPPMGISEAQSLDRRMKLKSYLLGAETILAVSESFADIYRKSGLTNCEVSKNGVSSGVKWKPKNTKHSESVILGHFGGMSRHKGYDLVKEAIKALNSDKIELIVVDHSKGSDFKRKAIWSKCEVTFIGRQPQDSMVQLYQSIDVLLAPSIWPESYGLVTREATACGCWVVASDIGGIGEDVDEGVNGHRVKRDSVEDLIRVLELISKDPIKYKGHSKTNFLRKSDDQVAELVNHHYCL